MNEAGILSHALTTVLYAAKKEGCDLEKLLQHAQGDIIGNNSLRPPPQHQEAVITAITQAINDIKNS